jgi:flagellar basal body L-ring protein FlgH
VISSSRIAALLISALILTGSIAAFSKTLWRDRNPYSPESTLAMGDILVVQIEDISQIRFQIALTSSNSFNITSNPDANLTGFLPKVSGNKKVDNNDNTNISGRGNMKISVAARVTKKLADGKYEINGIREYSINGVTNRFLVSGVIDPALLRGRSVFSRDIANFRLEIRGVKEGVALDLKRPALKAGEAAKGALTEEEKQKIILDYMQKMIRELSR